jgi:hypothetical protein
MVRLEDKSPKTLFDTLADWNTHLKTENRDPGRKAVPILLDSLTAGQGLWNFSPVERKHSSSK